jgi:hypothetical protein
MGYDEDGRFLRPEPANDVAGYREMRDVAMPVPEAAFRLGGATVAGSGRPADRPATNVARCVARHTAGCVARDTRRTRRHRKG